MSRRLWRYSRNPIGGTHRHDMRLTFIVIFALLIASLAAVRRHRLPRRAESPHRISLCRGETGTAPPARRGAGPAQGRRHFHIFDARNSGGQECHPQHPIVFAGVSDPLIVGLVATLPRPGGNVTGVTLNDPELSAKRLSLVKEAVPAASRVAILANPDFKASASMVLETKSAARALGLEIQVLRRCRLTTTFRRLRPIIRPHASLGRWTSRLSARYAILRRSPPGGRSER